MQVSPWASAFFFPRLDEPLTRALEISGEPEGLVGHESGVSGGTDLVREILKEPPFCVREPLFPGSWSQHQPANRLAPVDEGQAKRVLYGISGGRRGLEGVITL